MAGCTTDATSTPGDAVTSTAPHDWIAALRASHDRLAALIGDLDEQALAARSYDSDWTLADVASHLGSGAEIFGLVLDAGLRGDAAPGSDVLVPIWDVWNAKSPVQQRDDALVADAAFVARFEAMTDDEVAGFALSLWGQDFDLGGFARLRLAEHPVHVWDIAVALDPTALVAADAVDLLIGGLPLLAARSGRPSDPAYTVRIRTTDPVRDLVVTTSDPVVLAPADPSADYDGEVSLPAEAFVRLVYGRLDIAHTPPLVEETGTRGLADLRETFPGF
jgi:uncharacterized protein (TIGR03083 family)